ncbi:16S rRNA (guanine(966)-N(2))-methyltransferase RsmD [Oceanivirga salmonicida]|uniref:16S rRNA (guanine(966)-N(2))-methyltransferase RsmD n=1 Tax=Oceanivirga salmonicida TaxID=1769291 RepID=UPI0012E2B891|nr:16S rRNA (guanine(966)-N(2))-methyltransferase RsmD [Oceanivirga salmonicida]
MRITSGKLKNRVVLSREGFDTRPTLERIKESIFSIIYDKVIDAKFLDLYSGTGNMSFEALSRGAKRAIMIEKDYEALNVIIDNVTRFKLEKDCRAYKNDSLRAIEILKRKNEKFDIIFMDPPYKENLTTKTLEKLSEFDILEQDGIIICEHANYEKLDDKIMNLVKYDEREYNKKIISFFRKEG